MPYVKNAGAKIYWEEHGSGTPLLLIMGLGYTAEMWHRTRPAMAEHYRTITFDNRGVGRSEVPDGPYPIATMAADAVAVLDAAGVEQAPVFGISMGGIIAQELALQYPNRVRALVLGCTHHGGPQAIMPTEEVLGVLAARGTMPVEEGIYAMVPYIYDAATPRERIEEDLAIRRRTFPTSTGYFGQLQGIMAYESRPRLPQLAVPTLVIHGTSDQLVPPGNAERLAQLIPGAQLVLLPNASHIFMTDQPEASHQTVLAFLCRFS